MSRMGEVEMDVTLAQLGDRRLVVDRSVLDQGWAFDGAPPDRSRFLWWAADVGTGRPVVTNVVVGFVDATDDPLPVDQNGTTGDLAVPEAGPGLLTAADRVGLEPRRSLLSASVAPATPDGVAEERLTLGLLGLTPLVQFVRVYTPVLDAVPILRALATVPVDVLDGMGERVGQLLDALEVRS